jgi:hypothetical protein
MNSEKFSPFSDLPLNPFVRLLNLVRMEDGAIYLDIIQPQLEVRSVSTRIEQVLCQWLRADPQPLSPAAAFSL